MSNNLLVTHCPSEMFTHRVTANTSGLHTMFDLKYQTHSAVTMTKASHGFAVQSIKYKDCVVSDVI